MLAGKLGRDLKAHLRRQYTPEELCTLVHEAVDVLAEEKETNNSQ